MKLNIEYFIQRYKYIDGRLFSIKHKKFVGNLNYKGYMKFNVGRRGHTKQFYIHRVIWALFYGNFPRSPLDHINGIRTDNRIENLRLSSDSANACNRRIHREGRPVGVYKTPIGKWAARAPRNFLNRSSKRRKYIGVYQTIEEAGQAVVEFCKKGNS